MATGSLAKSLSNLNLSRRKTQFLTLIIITCTQISSFLSKLDEEYELSQDMMSLVMRGWAELMMAIRLSLL